MANPESPIDIFRYQCAIPSTCFRSHRIHQTDASPFDALLGFLSPSPLSSSADVFLCFACPAGT